MKNMAISFILLFIGTLQNVYADDRSIYEGYYWNEDKSAVVQLTLENDSIKGTTVWSTSPADQTDTQNPDPTLKKRPIIGMAFLWGFDYLDKKNQWKNGKVYDPNNGKTYDAKLALKKDGKILEMRGYIGISLLGRTEKFERLDITNIPKGWVDIVRSVLSTE